MNPVVAAVGDAIIVSLFWALIIGRINHVNNKRQEAQAAIIFHQQETITDLVQQKSPIYQIRSDGVNPVVRRNPTDPRPLRQSTRPPGELLVMPDMDDIPSLEPYDTRVDDV